MTTVDDRWTGLWHVTLTLAGDPLPGEEVRAAVERLAHQRPFLHAGRYESARAELRYWEESGTLLGAATLALRLWDEHRSSAALPDWSVVGLEVLGRATYQQRCRAAGRPAVRSGAGVIQPF